MNPDLKSDLFANNGLLRLYPSHRPTMRNVAIILAVLVTVMLLSTAIPTLEAARGIAHYLPLHTLLETFAIVMAMLVFAIVFTARFKTIPANITLLGVMFLGVAFLDFSHTISYAGMPDFVTPSGPEKGINFWLVARTLAALALVVVATLPWQAHASRVKYFMFFTAMLLVLAISHWAILWHPELLPRTFIPGQGLTAFKIYFEYAIIALNLVTAALLWWRMLKPLPYNAAMLFGAVCTMVMSEFLFTLYADVTDIYNLLGHVYKLVSYLFIYRAVFVTIVEQPYQQLSTMQAQLQATLNALPDLMLEVDEQGYILSYHAATQESLAIPSHALMNKTLREILPQESTALVMAAVREAGENGYSHGKQYPLQTAQGNKKWHELSVARKTAKEKEESTYVILSRDITEQKEREHLLRLQSQRAAALLKLPRVANQLDEKTFMQRGLEMAENLTGSEISFIHLVNHGGEEIELTAWSRRTLEHYCTAAYDSHYPMSQAGIWADALREGKPVMFNDYANYPHKRGLPEGHSSLQRLISVPVIENGKVVMLTGVGNKPTDYNDLDVETVQLISNEIWHHVIKARKEKSLSLDVLKRVNILSQHVPGMLYQFLLRPDGTSCFPYASSGIKNIYGVLPEQVSHDAEAVFKVIHPDDFQRVSECIQESARTLSNWHCEYRVNLPGDGTIWVEGVSTPELTPDGGILWHGHILDITERKKAESQLHEQIDELNRWQQAMFGREDRLITMKQEVNALLAQLGQPPRYAKLQGEGAEK